MYLTGVPFQPCPKGTGDLRAGQCVSDRCPVPALSGGYRRSEGGAVCRIRPAPLRGQILQVSQEVTGDEVVFVCACLIGYCFKAARGQFKVFFFIY